MSCVRARRIGVTANLVLLGLTSGVSCRLFWTPTLPYGGGRGAVGAVVNVTRLSNTWVGSSRVEVSSLPNRLGDHHTVELGADDPNIRRLFWHGDVSVSLSHGGHHWITSQSCVFGAN